MSALAHWLEQAGLHTVVIGLVRLHLEKMQPPRALWVPFELGRPLGPPTDRTFQRQVMLQALSMIETATAPAIEDFAADDPRSLADPTWLAPHTGDAKSVADELRQLAPVVEAFARKAGRSSVGVAGLELPLCARIIDQTIANRKPATSQSQHSDMLQFRYACDDLKMAWSEAALASGKPSSRQVHDWFWLQTHLGQSLRQLRADWLDSGDEKLAGIGARFIVPHRWRV